MCVAHLVVTSVWCPVKICITIINFGKVPNYTSQFLSFRSMILYRKVKIKSMLQLEQFLLNVFKEQLINISYWCDLWIRLTFCNTIKTILLIRNHLNCAKYILWSMWSPDPKRLRVVNILRSLIMISL